jgi:hypothetical protein
VGEDRPVRRVGARVGTSVVLAVMAASSAAQADIFAVTDKVAPSPRTDRDITLIDTSGLGASLPSGINTTADEGHPSISADGTRLVFLRHDAVGDTTRIIVTDLTSGQTSDVVNGIDASTIRPRTPSITTDGKAVLVGSNKVTGPLSIDLSNFPSGPYPHTDLAGANNTFEPIAVGSSPGSLFGFGISGSLAVSYGTIGGSALKRTPVQSGVSATHVSARHPSIASPDGTPALVLVKIPDGLHTGRAAVCSPLSGAGGCLEAVLPANVNNGSFDVSSAAFTPDGRYIGFVRNDAGHARLFVWSVDTQALLDSVGTDLGAPTNVDSSNLSLFEKPTLVVSSVSSSGVIRFGLVSSALVGILVQRVTGHHKLFGHTVPTLGPARRVPLGSFPRGHSKVRWNLRVKGKRLAPGTYQVTPRALRRSGKVRDLGKSRILHIRHG